MFHLIPGLTQRSFSDQENAISKIPIGIVPGGSGNGLARSLSHLNHETFDCQTSALNIVSGNYQPMDLLRVKIDGKKEVYSFLSIGWAFTSDCDIESECLRFLVSIYISPSKTDLAYQLFSVAAKRCVLLNDNYNILLHRGHRALSAPSFGRY